MQDWQAVRCALAQAENIILFPHIHADGDALGSAFGFGQFLCGTGKTVQIALEELPPANLSFLYAADALPDRLEYFVFCPQNPQKILEDALAITVDTSDVKRLGSRAELFFEARGQLRIDHHISADTFAEITVCNPEWAATAEGIWELIKTHSSYRDNPYLRKVAECIYTGILTDTGCFAYANVTAETHRIAAELIDLSGSMAWQ